MIQEENEKEEEDAIAALKKHDEKTSISMDIWKTQSKWDNIHKSKQKKNELNTQILKEDSHSRGGKRWTW